MLKVFNHILSRSRLLKITIDIDPSVIKVEGRQEGSAKGYNPKKELMTATISSLSFVMRRWLAS